jgi:hypothetical protein
MTASSEAAPPEMCEAFREMIHMEEDPPRRPLAKAGRVGARSGERRFSLDSGVPESKGAILAA